MGNVLPKKIDNKKNKELTESQSTTKKTAKSTSIKTEKKNTDSKEIKQKTSQPKKTIESKSINKAYFAIIPIAIIIIIAGFLLFTTTSDAVDAQLIIENGSVQVKHFGSWADATNGMNLYQSDSIKTGDNTSASIIILKGSIIRLDENTEITIKEIIQGTEINVTIQQDAGRTWNTVQKISGIDNYEVETPTTVASVRGTSFDVNVDNDGVTIVSIVKGIVNISITENGTVYSVELTKNWSITVSHDIIGDQLDGYGHIEQFEPDEWIQDNLLEDNIFKDSLKEIIYKKIEPYIDDLKSLYGMTDEEIEVLIVGFINGDFSIPPETPEKFKELFDLS